MREMKSKYYNEKTVYNGVKFDSKKESLYARKLDILKNAKGNEKVLSYQMQVPFQVELSGVKICKYILDFQVMYSDRTEYVDVKGIKTPMYRLKKKLVEAQFGIIIKEV